MTDIQAIRARRISHFHQNSRDDFASATKSIEKMIDASTEQKKTFHRSMADRYFKSSLNWMKLAESTIEIYNL